MSNVFAIGSNDGQDSVEISLVKKSNSKDLFVMQSMLKGRSYDRSISIEDELQSLDFEDYCVKLPQIITTYVSLHKLLDSLDEYLKTKLLFSCALADHHEQQLMVAIEVSPDFVCDIDKPVFVFAYSTHRLAIDVRFVVDQSCVSQFCSQLRDLLPYPPTL